MQDVFLDFESYYDRQYSLRKLSMQEYIMDPRFHETAVSIAIGDAPVQSYDHTRVKEALASVDWADANLICHNTIFDGAILAWRHGIRPRMYSCTLSMGRAMFGSLLRSNALKEMATLVNLYKDTVALTNMLGVRAEDMVIGSEMHDRFMAYVGEDTETCRRLYRLMMQGFPAIERVVVHLLTRMYIDGSFALDNDLLTQAIGEEETHRAMLLSRVGVEDESDLRSRDKFAELLRNQGVEPPTKISPSTGEDTFAFAKDDLDFIKLLEHDNPLVGYLVEAKLNASSNIVETRARKFLQISENAGGKLHVPLQYSGAHTHRFSGLDKLNFQNIPKGGALRKALKAPPGYKVVVVDASQIEARLVAWLAGQMELIEAFNDGRDVYGEFATKVYSRPINKHDDPAERFVGKTGVLGLGYGAGGPKFYFTLITSPDGWEGSEEFAHEVVQTYRTGYPEIPALWRQLESLLLDMRLGNTVSLGPLTIQKNRILLPSGLHLSYPKLRKFERYDSELDYMRRGWEYFKPRYNSYTNLYGGKMLENICQALARIQITETMVRMHAWDPDVICVLQVHDELVYIAPEHKAETVMNKLIEFMSLPPKWSQCFDYPLPLAAEGAIGDSYGEAK